MAFGGSSSAFNLGASSAPGLFGASQSQPSLFGTPQSTASSAAAFGFPAPASGSNLFGASAAASAPTFGSASVPSLFGSSTTATFGSTSAAPTFGQTGQGGTAPFASSSASLFAQSAAAPAFGASAPAAFGSSTAPTTAFETSAQSSSAGLFNAFGSSSAPAVGSVAPFGSASAPALPSSSQPPSSGFTLGTSSAPNLFSTPASNQPSSATPAPAVSGGFPFASPQTTTALPSALHAASAAREGSAAFDLGAKRIAPSSNAPTSSSLALATSQPTVAASLSLPAPTKSEKPADTGFSFGSSGARAMGTAPASSAAAPGGGFSFPGLGAKSSAPQTTSAASARAASVALGAPVAPAAPVASAGFGFGAGSSSAAATTTPASSAGFLLGTPGSTAAGLDKTAPAGGFSFGDSGSSAALALTTSGSALAGSGSNKKTTAAAGTAASAAAGTLTSFGLGAPAASATGAASALGTTVAAASGSVLRTTRTPHSVPSDIKDLSLDEVVNKWTDEIADLAARFQSGASMVSKWDRSIVSNEDKIVSLHKDAQSLQIAHKELSSNLDVILSQQSELHALLDALESDVEQKIGSNSTQLEQRSPYGTGGMHGDVERESMHRMAIEIMEELDWMAVTIRDLVVDLNKGRDPAGNGTGDTVGQIVSVLNAHLDSLQYLDDTSNALQKRLADVTRACEVISQDTEQMLGRRLGGTF